MVIERQKRYRLINWPFSIDIRAKSVQAGGQSYWRTTAFRTAERDYTPYTLALVIFSMQSESSSRALESLGLPDWKHIQTRTNIHGYTETEMKKREENKRPNRLIMLSCCIAVVDVIHKIWAFHCVDTIAAAATYEIINNTMIDTSTECNIVLIHITFKHSIETEK